MNVFELDIADTLVRREPSAAEDVTLQAAQAWQAAGSRLLPPTRGTVFGVLLNDGPALAALGEAVHEAPYKAPPKAPVLYIKPRNTLCSHGEVVPVPEGAEGFWVGGTLGLVIGRTLCQVKPGEALAHLAGYTVATDLTLPHESYYRPSLPFKVRDRSCPIGPWVRSRAQVADPDKLDITLRVDGKVALQANTSTLIRSVQQLLVDISEFMTLQPGDVLLAGMPAKVPLARAGQTVAVEIAGVGMLENRLVSEREYMEGVRS